MMRTFIAASVVFCSAMALAASASAQTATHRVGETYEISRNVKLGDLDLHTAAGAKRAAFRIELAAASACGGDYGLSRQESDFIPCETAAIDRAVTKLGSPLVSSALGRWTTLAQR
jgi:UrcA family protein